MLNTEDYINNLTQKIIEEISQKRNFLIIEDIIKIYNGKYESYKQYIDELESYNNFAIKTEQVENDIKSLFYLVRKVAISSIDFDYIKKLKTQKKEEEKK